MSKETRSTAAILFTDIVGFAALAQKNEALALELLNEHNVILRSVFPLYEGNEVKTTGDGFLVTFPDPLHALECAVSIQEKLHERNQGRPKSHQILIRAGIHVGEVQWREKDLFGDAVNVASRVFGLARPGGICITEEVYRFVKPDLDRTIVWLGKRRLKNIQKPLSLYRILFPWEPAPMLPRTLTRLFLPGHRFRRYLFVGLLTCLLGLSGLFGLNTLARHYEVAGPLRLPSTSLAVLPFTYPGNPPSEAIFCDSITERLTRTLGRLSDLRVISWSSSVQASYQETTLPALAKRLNASLFLEGTVLRHDQTLTLTIRIHQAVPELLIHESTYEDTRDRIPLLLRRIAMETAEAIGIAIRNLEKDYFRSGQSSEAGVMALCMEARRDIVTSTEESLWRAIDHYHRAMDMDPFSPEPVEGIAEAYTNLVIQGWIGPREGWPIVSVQARKALQMDPGSASAVHSLSLARMYFEHDWIAAERGFRLSLSLFPNNADARRNLAACLCARGQRESAQSEVRRAMLIDPLSHDGVLQESHIFFCSNRPEEAVRMLLDHLPSCSHPTSTWKVLGKAYLLLDKIPEALDALDRAKTDPPDPEWLMYRFMALNRAGRNREASRLMDALRAGSDDLAIAKAEASVSRIEVAFTHLEQAMEENSPEVIFLGVEPLLSPLRGDPRYIDLLKRLNLIQDSKD
ncbi:MAG TPA: adenylate/guanylate cyclase domain-containing protein [Thermoanaerobaculia bacterium]|nr:adenylate/guanylate cyclase domain-containing protein [Thermoanaerobaculia bacterium]HUM30403.1 adenylate/guanylate cyclase domain-containing protein [Thermoanaerobaculia bacterium]HXK68586.1 adenylate/guanylate cyclase domain-containing protein [Thermoanaerobaculia bacterium]